MQATAEYRRTARADMNKRNPGLLFAVVSMLLACSNDAPPPPVEDDKTPVTSVFNCPTDNGELTFTVRTMGEKLAAWLPRQFGRPYLVLERARSASGSRYEADEVMVWLHGNEAMLEVDGNTFKSCTRDAYASVWEHAKLGGVDFRATGNEPGWVLEISNGTSLRLDYDYGQSLIETRADEPVNDAAARQTIYKAESDGRTVTVRISVERCTDSMSGFEFESTVIVNVDDRELRGCGRPLH